MTSLFALQPSPESVLCPKLMRQVFGQLPVLSQIQGMIAMLRKCDTAASYQKLVTEIVPRIRSLEAPEERMLAAADIRKRALLTVAQYDGDCAVPNTPTALLDAVFHDHEQWTPAQRRAGQALMADLQCRAVPLA